jgi:HAD superfamily hydrolase (TIGR01509 family)
MAADTGRPLAAAIFDTGRPLAAAIFDTGRPLAAAIFDMDGLLTESESRWRRAEREMADELGLPLTEADLEATMGVRMGDVARRWFDAHPWLQPPTPAQVADRVVDRVVELTAGAVPLEGVPEAIERCRRRGLRLALCSSSPPRLIDSLLDRLDLADRFEVVHSADGDAHGKPHPLPYLLTAAELGVEPSQCLVFEDSFSGCVSAKAAGMVTVAVPDPALRGDVRFGVADAVLASLAHLDDDTLDALEARRPLPSLARPRFHLAVPVDDLDLARSFYGGVLGCREGRSDGRWVDFDLWGHQLVAHLAPEAASGRSATNPVDGEEVPASHFGLVLPIAAWRHTVRRLEAAGTAFVIPPQVRFAGQPGEQHTCFVRDPAGNVIELKAFADDRAVFARPDPGSGTER